MVIDLTKLLNDNNNFNKYVFNNSLVCLNEEEKIFLMCYRYISYNIPNKKQIHPWSMWVSGRNIYFENKNNNPKLFNPSKYRKNLENGLTVKLDGDKQIDLNYFSYDSTGFAVLKYENESFTVLKKKSYIFSNSNQDARLQNIDGKYILSYHGFFKTDSEQVKIVMVYREVSVDLPNYNTLTFGPEIDMLKDNALSVEKNCTFNNSDILYSINGNFSFIRDNKIYSRPVSQIQQIIDYYDDIYFSLSTPSIGYDDKYKLAVGHVKIDYRIYYENSQIDKFKNVAIESTVHKHGKFIYFMFLFLYNNEYEITHISHAFIPTDNKKCHLPYLLVFPTGLIKYHDKYLISYGEGDVRTKILSLSKMEINNLLVPINEISSENYKFCFYNTDDHLLYPNEHSEYLVDAKSKKILVLGYYGHHNIGDDVYEIIFHYIQDNFLPDTEIHFIDPDILRTQLNIVTKYHLVLLGGGDVINPYFMEVVQMIKKILPLTKIIAISIGIPYPDLVNEYFPLLDLVYIRNKRDKNLRNSDVQNINYCPDLAFLLPTIYKSNNKKIFSKDNFNICVVLARSYYHPLYQEEYQIFITKIARTLDKLSVLQIDNKPVKIYFLPFNNDKNTNENDHIICHDTKKIMSTNTEVLEHYPNNNVKRVYYTIQNADYVICSRFHAHIFSIIHKVPFVSLSTTRKCYELMKEIGMKKQIFVPVLNELNVPVDFDEELFYQFLENNIMQHQKQKIYIEQIKNSYHNSAIIFLKSLIKIIRGHFEQPSKYVTSNDIYIDMCDVYKNLNYSSDMYTYSADKLYSTDFFGDS
ncbi:MAG: putative WcaK-like polysaccharide pyruvyl transferase [Satyrvirus sp.]|uniref:Putative WcaK-like polysaccharide pyruvyl transferase n=1 Tax=Satyrvirus sp. TaxID=2487771 RepID=A0A3G5AG18_9VIRU|nr:MAG: putative WcaK-like polysaccharide pyruvyl transferase [Satyrvirus sp.]